MSDSREIKQQLGKLFIRSLALSHPLYLLQTMREKMETGSLDRKDLQAEIVSLRYTLRELNEETQKLHDLLKQQ
jgi:hypothetical protein